MLAGLTALFVGAGMLLLHFGGHVEWSRLTTLSQPLGTALEMVLAALSLAGSNTIGNVPAVIMLLAIWPNAPEGALYGLALLSTLAGNLFLVGSIANLIVAERAAASGVRFGFADHLRAGVPMTLASEIGRAHV